MIVIIVSCIYSYILALLLAMSAYGAGVCGVIAVVFALRVLRFPPCLNDF